MPTAGDMLIEELYYSLQGAKNSNKNMKAKQVSGEARQLPDVSFIPVAPTEVKSR